jgi:four helix bundle protein
MSFETLVVAQQIIPAVKPLIDRVRVRDADLARQMQRAAASIALNAAEGRRRFGGDRRHLFRVALGSAAELGAALDVAVGFGHLDAADAAEAAELADRVRGLLWPQAL